MDRIGHYTIVSELGRGGMGVVYKAHEESLNRFVAIKVLGEHLAEDPAFLSRFVREAQAAAALSHPNIIQIYFIGEDAGRRYFVMEYVAGRSLLSMLRLEGRIPVPRAAGLVLQAANGLAAAHDKGFLHRDIKPANLIVDERGLLKIADFGLALPREALTRLTTSGMLVGTPGYLSPEQCRDEELDQRTDIYSLGVTFYEILGGRLPFSADSPLALLRKILEEEPPDIATLNEAVGDETRRVVHRMIAKDRDLRYADCHELAGDLERVLRAEGAGEAVVVPSPRPRASPGAAAATAAAGIAGIDEGATVRTPSRVLGNDAAAGAAAPAAATARAGEAGPATAPPSAPPPLQEAPAALVPTAVALTSTPPERPARGSRAPLVALVLIVIVVAGAAGALVAFRKPLLGRWLGTPRTASEIDVSAAEGSSGRTSAAQPPKAVADRREQDVNVASPSAPPVGLAAQGGPADAAGAGVQSGGRVSSRRGAQRPAPAVDTGAAASRRAGEPQPEAAVTLHGLAFAVTGERALTGAVGDLLRDELAGAGVEALDATALPNGEALLRGGADPTALELLRAMAGEGVARVVTARVEPLGQRELSYMGRREVAYTSRVTLACYAVATERPIGPVASATVEYTALNLRQTTEKALREAVRPVIERCR